jgi:hypothetical protein
MQDDPRIIELLADMLHEQKDLRQEQTLMREEQKGMREEMKGIREEQKSMRLEQQRTTQAILSLTSLLQKALIEPAEKQSREIADIKERLDRLENAH